MGGIWDVINILCYAVGPKKIWQQTKRNNGMSLREIMKVHKLAASNMAK
jgi:hypothetical protein